MIEFTHALETLEMLTDAFKLEQRVNLTINHDHEEGKLILCQFIILF